MDSAQTEELARRIARWVRESLADGPAVADYEWDTVTQVLTIIHEDDDGVEKFTLAQLAENDPEKFEQFALLRPSPERVEAVLTLVSMTNSGGDAADAGAAAGAFPLFLCTIQPDFVCAVGPAPCPEPELQGIPAPCPEPELQGIPSGVRPPYATLFLDSN